MEGAHDALAKGRIKLDSAQNHDVVTPLASVVSPSMKLQVIEDRSGFGRRIFSPLNGGMTSDLRFGVAEPQVLQLLKLLNGEVARLFVESIKRPIPLIPFADAGLANGDDCHSITSSATLELARYFQYETNNAAIADFLKRTSSFFLNTWMAACRCILSATENVPNSTMLTAMGANGVEVGIRYSGQPTLWHTSRSTVPVPIGQIQQGNQPLPAIGDSAVIEALGFGAMCWTQTPFDVSAIDESVLSDLHKSSVLKKSLIRGFQRVSVPAGISVRDILANTAPPAISLGILDAHGKTNLLGRGLYTVALAAFESIDDSGRR